MSSSVWKTILAVAFILLLLGMLVSGYIMWGVALLVLLVVLGLGALLYRTQGPPER